MKQKNNPTATNEASRSRRGREPVSRPLFLSPQQEAERERRYLEIWDDP